VRTEEAGTAGDQNAFNRIVMSQNKLQINRIVKSMGSGFQDDKLPNQWGQVLKYQFSVSSSRFPCTTATTVATSPSTR
jgi:hypothetical protein